MKPQKEVVCPNCFGNSCRQILTTEISRNQDLNEPPLYLKGSGLSEKKLRQTQKLLCIRCGNEVNPKGGRA